MLDRTVGQLQAMLKTKTSAVTRRSVDLLLDQFAIVGMNSREGNFQSRVCFIWIAFKDSEGLVGPEDLPAGNFPAEAACVTKSLGFGQISFASPGRFFRNLREGHPEALLAPLEVAVEARVLDEPGGALRQLLGE